MNKTEEVLRSGVALDGLRIFLVHESAQRSFRIGTRWRWLAKFRNVYDACDAFEALELIAGDEVLASKHLVREIRRVPRSRFTDAAGMQRITYLVDTVERLMAGQRPIRTRGNGRVQTWTSA